MINVLVTGANGQLGRALQKLAGEYGAISFTFLDQSQLDITKADQIKDAFEKGQFHYCINCAAYTHVDEAEKNPAEAFRINADGVKNLAEACERYSVVLVHISTDYVFDGTKEHPYTIDDQPNPINEYGKSKWQGEQIVLEKLKEYFIVRTSWLYSFTGQNFYTTILKKAKNRETISVTEDQLGCPTRADNLARYLLELINQKDLKYGIRHFTDGEAMTWFEFAKKILKDHNLDEEVSIEKAHNYRTFAKRPKNSVLI